MNPAERGNEATVMKRADTLSFVIPAYNEEEAIVETLKCLSAIISKTGCSKSEIIVVDDGSSDRTAELAEANGARVIRKPHNIGYGHSLKIGIKAARFDTIMIMDADGTYPAQEVPKLLEIYRRGFNMVVGERTGEHFRESWLKAPLRRILRLIVEFTAGRRIPDPNSGLRIFSKAEIVPLFPFLSNAFSFTISSTLAYMLNHYYVAYTQIPYYRRIGRTKVRMFRDSLRVIQYIVSAILYYNPIKMFLIIAIFMALAATPITIIGLATGLNWLAVIGIVLFGMIIPIFAAGLIVEAQRQYILNPTVHGEERPVDRFFDKKNAKEGNEGNFF